MKKLLLTLSLVLTISASILADNESPGPTAPPPDPDGTVGIPLPEKKEEPDPKRKRMPSGRFVVFNYDISSGICRFTLPEGIGGVSVTIESEEGDTYFSYVPAENPVWPLFLGTGEYLVTCDADNGSHFEGYVWID